MTGPGSAPTRNSAEKTYLTVTISSAVNLLVVGVILVAFVILAPNGIVGLVRHYWQHKPDDIVGRRKIEPDAQGTVP